MFFSSFTFNETILKWLRQQIQEHGETERITLSPDGMIYFTAAEARLMIDAIEALMKDMKKQRILKVISDKYTKSFQTVSSQIDRYDKEIKALFIIYFDYLRRGISSKQGVILLPEILALFEKMNLMAADIFRKKVGAFTTISRLILEDKLTEERLSQIYDKLLDDIKTIFPICEELKTKLEEALSS